MSGPSQGRIPEEAAILRTSPKFLPGGRWFEAARAQEPDVIRHTYSGLLAFIVPGNDAYSLAQGVSTASPGAVGRVGADALIRAIDDSAPFMPRFAAQMAALLNAVARAVTPDAAAEFFPSAFASLPFAGKAVVFQFMDCNDAYKAMSEALPALVDALIDADVCDGAVSLRRGTQLQTPRRFAWLDVSD